MGPMPVFDEEKDVWNLFYVSYRARPNLDTAWLLNYDGRIWRSKSVRAGIEGIGGPYVEDSVILEYGENSDPWEGLQGVDSFFPFKVRSRWLAFYGSAQTQYNPCRLWAVGLAGSTTIAGPWRRLSQSNPVNLRSRFAENPIVEPLARRGYLAFVDGGHINDAFGYTTSGNGLEWSPARFIPLDGATEKWWTLMRTPVSFIEEQKGCFHVYFTAYTKSNFASLGKAILRRIE
jgi:hypothetical protein